MGGRELGMGSDIKGIIDISLWQCGADFTFVLEYDGARQISPALSEDKEQACLVHALPRFGPSLCTTPPRPTPLAAPFKAPKAKANHYITITTINFTLERERERETSFLVRRKQPQPQPRLLDQDHYPLPHSHCFCFQSSE
ncbi:uncharacterized protein G2W53_001948 [Senna tora]|uniref:Uncharacterized protein n=1 Tax=Senna tora TaxID=362788 RepID=A0A834XI73_9FABA|nr:uncharacterized protein G2W53_001948 [Senna tora]